MTPTKPDPRTLTQLGESIFQGIANLNASIHPDETTDALRQGLDRLADTVATVTEHLGASGAGRAPVGGAVPTATPENVSQANSNVAVDLAVLAYRMHQEGLPVNPALIDGMEMLNGLHEDLTHERPDIALSEPVPFQVPVPKLDTRPIEGTRPGERRTSMDQAGRSFQDLLRAQNGRREELFATPLGEVAHAMRENADASKRPQTYRAERKTYQAGDHAKAYEPPAEYRPERREYQGRPRSTTTTPWSDGRFANGTQ